MKSLCYLFVLLAFSLAAGCAKKQQESITAWVSSGASFEVDEIMYYGELGAVLGEQRHVVSSSIVISPNSEQISFADVSDALNGKPTSVLDKTSGEKIVVKSDTLYYFQEGQIVFEKEYRDIGIDAGQITVPIDILSDYLKPILEQIIREHVKPQKPETEE